ncbi:hypothetical protein EMCRGX_G007109 [Ephydatia muelleri]
MSTFTIGRAYSRTSVQYEELIENGGESKHPKRTHPVPPPSVTTPYVTIVPNDFNIMAVQLSFPKITARSYYLLAFGKVPVLVSKYLAGGSLTALMKDKADLSLDIRPLLLGKPCVIWLGMSLCGS